MPQKIRELMTPDPVVLPGTESLTAAARAMRENNIGAVLVARDGRGIGILTDRDIVVRALAAGRSPDTTHLEDVASTAVTALSPDDDADRALAVMRERALRRIPVVDGDRPIGILSLGDLAIERGEGTVLADVSAAAPNR